MRQFGMTARFMLVAAAFAALAPAAAPAQDFDMSGTMVWNVPYWETVRVGDYFGPNYKINEIQPVVLVGARNGVFSGQIVVSNSNGPINGLKVTTTELKQTGENTTGKIGTDSIIIRYAELAQPQTSWAPSFRYDRLLGAAPEEVAIFDVKPQRGFKPKNEGPVAAVTVWFTVRIPKDAPAGDYEGTITVDGENMAVKPVKVPLKVKVNNFVIPEPKDFQTRNMSWMNPDRVAMHYKVQMWSDKHFELMGKSMAMMAELGSRQLFVNLVTHYPSQDNTETMIKWVKQDDGSFKYDLTAFDKYMDTAAKNMGKPFVIRLNMWCPEGKEDPKLPQVLMVDPKTGKTEPLSQPVPIGSEESYKFWKPVLDEIRARMDKRGWSDVTCPNWHQYCGGPTKPCVTMIKKIWPDVKWADMDHGRRYAFDGNVPEDKTATMVQSTVWNEGDLTFRGYKAGLKPGIAMNGHARDRHREWSDLWEIRGIAEEQIMKGNHGADPIGADLWPAEFKGRIISGAWANAALGPGNCTRSFLAPGDGGAIGTERFEALREGIQIAETMLFIQDALNGGKLDAAVAGRANKVLDERSQRMLDAWPKPDPKAHRKFNPSHWAENAQAREGELFAVAAEVAKAIGKN